ncbi:MAG: hypothetical protein RR682_03295 [Cetobacterium sp.]|uniref:hypothetical protein n=1 Tax=Cetobacterium sp. TaxID=2071632 RepID=UPI002FC8E86E
MMKKIWGIFFIFSLFFSTYVDENLTIERVEELRKKNIISEEDYNFLKAELDGKLQEKNYYDLIVNRSSITTKYPIIRMNNRYYFSLLKYFEGIEFKNYRLENNSLNMFLGKRLKNVVIDFNKGKIVGLEKTVLKQDEYFIENGDYFLESDLFRDIFLDGLDINDSRMKISMSTTYLTPKDIRNGLKSSEEKIESKNSMDDFYYTNSRELFDIGYMRFNFDKTFTKSDGIKDNDWSGLLEYQGPMLYGELTTTYDVRESLLTGANLYYPNLPNNHYLELRGTNIDNDYWEKSIIFEKDKGYFEDGKKFIIKENVPIGSRVELVYMGATIAIANEENGIVEFSNSEIKSDREYMLRIHAKDGQIFTRIIQTSDDFNQQNKGEFQYKLFASEDKESSKNILEIGTFYGVTENLTVGGDYYKTPELIDDKYIYVERAKGEIVYSNFLRTYPYTLVLGGEEILSPDIFDETTTFEGLFQIKINDLKLRYENGYYSEYYDSKKSEGFTVQYTPWNFLRLDYSYQRLEKYNGEKENGAEIDIEFTKNFKRILTTFQFEKNIEDEKRYSINLYYTGYRDYSMRWNNSITEAGGDFESTIELYNRATRNGLDYSFELSYSELQKEKFVFKVSIDYDNWFNFDMFAGDKGNYDVSVGLDRIVDLKNITKPLESMDSSRVKVITFLDENNNNKFDDNEDFIGNVEVKINQETKLTKQNKPTYFYGVPNDILYSFEPKVRKPGYDTINSKFSLKGKHGGNIEAYIPIKPLFTISGNLLLEDSTRTDIYEKVVIKIKDDNNETVSGTVPDEFGSYDISGLRAGKYIFEISSFGNEESLLVRTPIEVKYVKGQKNIMVINSKFIGNKIVLLAGENNETKN